MRQLRLLTTLSVLAGAAASTFAQTDSPVLRPPMRSLRTDVPACAQPSYPKAALRNEEQGTVTMSFLIGTDGAVHDSRIAKTSGSKQLDEAARVALAKCRFKPAESADGPVEAWVPVQYKWEIR